LREPFEPEVVRLDLGLPGMHGFQLAHKLCKRVPPLMRYIRAHFPVY
jgi:DNA-binding response OmpR family regulator